MFRITEDPSSGSLVQYLAKNTMNYSIVHVDMDKVSVMAAYCDRLCVCAVHCIQRHCDPKHVGSILKNFIILIVSTYYILFIC